MAEGRQGGFYLNPTDEDLSVGAEVVKEPLEFIGPLAAALNCCCRFEYRDFDCSRNA